MARVTRGANSRLLVVLLAVTPAVGAGVEAPTAQIQPPSSCVFVLHGLARGSRSMTYLVRKLSAAGFVTRNLDYPSTSTPLPELVSILGDEVRTAAPSCKEIHFVGYSLGAVVIRAYLESEPAIRLGRVVMIAAPNHGSQIVDSLGTSWVFRTLMGPAATELGTGPESLPNRLPPPRYPVGVIAGDRPLNPLGWFFIPGDHDGTVSVASTRLEGMSDFLLVHRTHTFIMNAPEVAAQTIEFLRNGRFEHEQAERR